VKMTRDELEFALSQYHDDTLPPLERSALDEVLATDTEARQILASYARLDAIVKQTPGASQLDWHRLQNQISKSLASEELPVRKYRIGGGAMRWLAIAAAVLIAFGIAVPMMNRTGRGTGRMAIEINPPGGAVAVSSGTTVEVTDHSQPGAQQVAEVSVGPSPSLASAGGGMQYNDVFMTRPSHVVIAVSEDAAQEMPSASPF